MKSFSWSAYTTDGKKRSGLIVAEDRADVSRKLRAQGLHPEDISPHSAAGAGLARRVRRLDADMQAVFARQMAVLIASGLTVDDALGVVGGSGGAGALDQVASRARALVREGAPLSEALEQGAAGFPPYVTAAIRAGEASRDLAAVLETIATHLETRRTDRAVLATALIYPAFVATASMIVCGVLMSTVAPELARMFEATGQPLPRLTEIMLGSWRWVADHAWLLGISAALLVIGIPLLLRRPAIRDRWHGILLVLPVLGRFATLDAASQYLRTLALVIGSRQPAVDAVTSATDVLAIRSFREESARVTDAIRAGSPLSAALGQTSFLPPVALQLIEAGEKSARVAQMTERAAILVETWLVNDRRRLASLIDPILMMLIGAFVLAIVLSVLLPIFDLQNTL